MNSKGGYLSSTNFEIGILSLPFFVSTIKGVFIVPESDYNSKSKY
jgi:hypothetical protein